MATIEQLQSKIDSEHAAIAKAQSKKAELAHKRTAALEAGDDNAVDGIDVDIGIADTAITRGRERIAILEQRIEETKAAQREADLDTLAAQTNQAREDGERLIAQYAKHASAIGELMRKLAAIDIAIERHNRTLVAAGREGVQSPNQVRCRPTVRGTRMVKRNVGIGEDCHPLHDVAVIDRNGNARHRDTGESLEHFSELEVETPFVEHGYIPAPLQAEVKLPRAQPDGPDYWPNNTKVVEDAAESQSTWIVGAVRELFRSKAA